MYHYVTDKEYLKQTYSICADMNMATDAESFEQSIRIPHRHDNFNPIRTEYSDMLKMQLAQGNNGLTKTKYIC